MAVRPLDYYRTLYPPRLPTFSGAGTFVTTDDSNDESSSDNALITENGDQLVTENGDVIVWV